MAKRRMFSLDIIDTDLFLEMPQSSRLLYYELCMRADDDGFVSSPKKIQKMVGCNEDDFKVLISKKFLIPFDTGVVVIRHWKIHNYIQKDRYKETIYLDEKKQLNQEKNGSYTKCIQDGYTGKVRLEEGKEDIPSSNDEEMKKHFELIWEIYPNKKGRAKAEGYFFCWLKGRNINKSIKRLTDEQMYYAVRKYAKECEDNKIEQQYIKHGDTFFNSYILDYVE